MRHTSIKQSGFTLVEIAIVLVIIGLLLGGVLKGQEMIENARIKGAAADMNGIVAAYNSYLDRFHAIPGDDGPAGTITGRGSAWAGVTAGGTNGVLNIAQGQVFTAPAGSEGTAFWQQLRAAGFISGDPTLTGVAALPRNQFNGLIGVGQGVTPPVGATAISVCLSQVPGKAARALDLQFDDGIPNRGTVMATVSPAGANTNPGAAAATISDDNYYTVCRKL